MRMWRSLSSVGRTSGLVGCCKQNRMTSWDVNDRPVWISSISPKEKKKLNTQLIQETNEAIKLRISEGLGCQNLTTWGTRERTILRRSPPTGARKGMKSKRPRDFRLGVGMSTDLSMRSSGPRKNTIGPPIRSHRPEGSYRYSASWASSTIYIIV